MPRGPGCSTDLRSFSAPQPLPPRRRGRGGRGGGGETPALVTGSIAETVCVGAPTAGPALLVRALRLAGVELAPRLRLGPGGSGLSGGQAQRVATARAIHRLVSRDGALLLLDEPTSAQDDARERALIAGLRELAAEGRCVLLTTHRDALAAAADIRVELAVARA